MYIITPATWYSLEAVQLADQNKATGTSLRVIHERFQYLTQSHLVTVKKKNFIREKQAICPSVSAFPNILRRYTVKWKLWRQISAYAKIAARKFHGV